MSGSSPAHVRRSSHSSTADPWDDWERRWEHAFQQFEEVTRAQCAAQQAEAEMRAEAERLQAEAEWRRKVEEAKRQGAQQAARRRAQAGSPSGHHQQRESSFPSYDQFGSGSKYNFKAGVGQSSNQSSSQSGSQGASQGRRWLPPRPPPAPSSSRKTANNDPQFKSFAEFDNAWACFEQKASNGGIRATDVPWPTSLPSVAGITDSDSGSDKKKKLRAALVRWHPDKWGRIIDSVSKDEQPLVMERVKEVTQRILDEKKRHGG